MKASSAFHPGFILCLGLCLCLGLTACSRLPRLDEVLPDQRTEYKKSEALPDLEVPPDLTTDRIQDNLAVPEVNADGVASYSTYQERVAARKRARESSDADADAVQLLADEQVVFVPLEAAAAFDGMREFFGLRGVALELDDTELGVLETSWSEQNEGRQRRRYKIFAEPGAEPGSTVMYLSGETEGLTESGEWQPLTTASKDLEPLARDLRTHFGMSPGAEPETAPADATAAAPARSSTAAADAPAEIFSAGEGRVFLSIPQDFAVVWPRVGVAIEQAGLKLLETDRTRGVYRVALTEGQFEAAEKPKKGMMSRLAFWRDDDPEDTGERQLSVTGVGAKTEIVVLDAEGKWDTSPGASQVLTTLLKQLNGG